jgi:hypothetical protein
VKEKVYTVIKPHFTVTEKEKHVSFSNTDSHSNSHDLTAAPLIDDSNSDDSSSELTADNSNSDAYSSDASAIIDSMKTNLLSAIGHFST